MSSPAPHQNVVPSRGRRRAARPNRMCGRSAARRDARRPSTACRRILASAIRTIDGPTIRTARCRAGATRTRHHRRMAACSGNAARIARRRARRRIPDPARSRDRRRRARRLTAAAIHPHIVPAAATSAARPRPRVRLRKRPRPRDRRSVPEAERAPSRARAGTADPARAAVGRQPDARFRVAAAGGRKEDRKIGEDSVSSRSAEIRIFFALPAFRLSDFRPSDRPES
jgi:hypothetical protein